MWGAAPVAPRERVVRPHDEASTPSRPLHNAAAVLLRLGRLAMRDGTDADIVRAARHLASADAAATLAVAVVDDGGVAAITVPNPGH